ncbi:MAG: hypothetical protein IKW64_07265 [Clostridia bacterium]|nr:hypothetical protein [Clostridia bacterium]
MDYREEKQFTSESKKEYVHGLNKIIEQRQNAAKNVRDEYFKDVFENQERYRQDFREMLGWPLVDYQTNTLPEVSAEKLSDEDGYTVFRMKFEILDELKMTGLFFKAETNEKKPLVILQHGGNGTPELISGVYGNTANYNDMLQRVRQNDVHVFAPQLLLWSDDYEVEYDRKLIDAQLKATGSSITAIEVFGITRIIDYFEKQEYVSKFGMVGLSYGGFYTLYTAAIDTRIKSAISCAFFNERYAATFVDWTWFKAAEKFDDAEVACLVYPRRLCIEIGDKDDLFKCKYGIRSFEKLKTLCKSVGTDWVNLVVFDGIHEFCKQDEPIHSLINDIK